MFRTRDQNPEKSEADSYGDANMLPLSTDEPIAGGASPHSSRAAHIERKKGNAYGNTHSLVCAESGKTTENRGIPPPANAAETAPESGRTFGRPLYGPAVLAGSMRCPSECPPSPKSEPRRQGAGRAFGDRFRRTQTRTRTVGCRPKRHIRFGPLSVQAGHDVRIIPEPAANRSPTPPLGSSRIRKTATYKSRHINPFAGSPLVLLRTHFAPCVRWYGEGAQKNGGWPTSFRRPSFIRTAIRELFRIRDSRRVEKLVGQPVAASFPDRP